ncbi:hypothetical protein D3C85_1801610 [compost metagenome]
MGNQGPALDLLDHTQIPKLHRLTQSAGNFLFLKLLGGTRMIGLQLQNNIGGLIVDIHACNGAPGYHHSQA